MSVALPRRAMTLRLRMTSCSVRELRGSTRTPPGAPPMRGRTSDAGCSGGGDGSPLGGVAVGGEAVVGVGGAGGAATDTCRVTCVALPTLSVAVTVTV
jgi:hypothetical protein